MVKAAEPLNACAKKEQAFVFARQFCHSAAGLLLNGKVLTDPFPGKPSKSQVIANHLGARHRTAEQGFLAWTR